MSSEDGLYAAFFREEEDNIHDELLEQQYQEFFEVIRIHLIIVLLVTALCFIANLIISKYKNIDLNNEVSLFVIACFGFNFSVF